MLTGLIVVFSLLVLGLALVVIEAVFKIDLIEVPSDEARASYEVNSSKVTEFEPF